MHHLHAVGSVLVHVPVAPPEVTQRVGVVPAHEAPLPSVVQGPPTSDGPTHVPFPAPPVGTTQLPPPLHAMYVLASINPHGSPAFA